ncbi:hypothetical protein [Sporolactobacillus inulinus]|jgi:predicted NUDIX family phosphoesterase|uniref:Nudix hydrolase domain-containing protein n=2 Tax=Sporolactobacillus inulinus TaxID=2078 RepID=A0A4Y1ZIJ4_9BACL|nr:hypothetical protein [Sporolactobacillus inulinus]KLI02632.1 hypothetical protein SINU_07025 [Sporolactobacillus inulinus CASD]GAY78754.1 hypothetical protein NBRC111894_4308 [Sporolactobacillus inulinus]GEB76520.1 hypothetical protein SIN01_08650 [Sporolactobacillus inulinus]
MGKMDEQIIVVKRSQLFDEAGNDLTFQGTEQDRKAVAALSNRMAEHYRVMRRGDAEENPQFKQPIPYAVLKKGDHYFTYRRLGGGGEQRLHGKLSIGVGGHMNRVEHAADFEQVLKQNLDREINEELLVQSAEPAEYHTIGLINDDQTEVGKVHIGVLVAISLPDDAEVTVREKDKLEGSWKTLQELSDPHRLERMESWSGFAIKTLQRH